MEEATARARRAALGLALSFEGGLALLAALVGWPTGLLTAASVRWDARAAGTGVLAALPLFLFFLLAAHWPTGPLRRIRAILDELLLPLLRPCTIADLALISLLAGVGEELLFRGILQGALARWLPFGPSLALASVVFGLAHLITPTYAVIATAIGAYLGWLWQFTGDLLCPIVTHALYDFLGLVYLLKIVPHYRRPAPLPGAAGAAELNTE